MIASRPRVSTPAEARALRRPIVYVQANIHAGEVEGKEALQMLLRDLALEPRANVLDSIVLIAVPIYNADGNEKVGPQAQQRTEQNGPELVGTAAQRDGARPQPRLREGRGAGDARVAGAVRARGIRTSSSTCTRPTAASTATR